MLFQNNRGKKINLTSQLLFLAWFGLFVFAGFIQPARAAFDCGAFKAQFRGIVDNLPQYCSASEIIMKAINIGLVAAGGIAVVFIMVGGYLYLTSAGNEEQAEKGRKTLTNSIIGLVVIIMSVVIVRIVAQTLQSNTGTIGSTAAPAGTTAATSPSNPAGSAGNGDAAYKAAAAKLSPSIYVLPTFSTSGTMKIYAVFNTLDNDSDVKVVCSGVGLAGAGLITVVAFPDKNGFPFKRDMPLTSDGHGNFTSQINIPGNVFAPGPINLTVSLCQNATIATRTVTATAP